MARICGFLLIICLIWIGTTVYFQGSDQAFGGLFARFGSESPMTATDSETAQGRDPSYKRLGNKVQNAYDAQSARVDRAVGATSER